MDPILTALVFAAGLAFGSFLNVCIARVPNNISIVTPRSRCPRCGAGIRWRDNVPLLSWLLLGGRCRDCRQPISLRYPMVELITGALFVACYASFGLTALTLKSCIFIFLVLGLIFMDAETGLLPAEFTYPGIVLGMVFAWAVPMEAAGAKFLGWYARWPLPASPRWLSVMDSGIAIVAGAGFFLLAWGAYYAVRRQDGLGFGDIALIAMVGAFLGLKQTVLVVFLSPVLGTACVAIWLAVTRGRNRDQDGIAAAPGNSLLKRTVPFGVFLGSSAMIALFFGDALWRRYLELFR